MRSGGLFHSETVHSKNASIRKRTYDRRYWRERCHRRNGETEHERRRPTLARQLKVICLLRLTSVAPFLLFVRFLRDLCALDNGFELYPAAGERNIDIFRHLARALAMP